MLVRVCRALKAEADAQRAVDREKQREMLKDLKEKSKADKEKQKQVGLTCALLQPPCPATLSPSWVRRTAGWVLRSLV